MERGLIWLPLLGVFIWLAWAGWNEYQKVEAYQRWSVNFDRHKYDIYAVLGEKDNLLTWGKPTRQQPTELKTINIQDIAKIQLKIDNHVIDSLNADLPQSGKNISLELFLIAGNILSIPFTEVAIAANWYKYLTTRLP